jgi:predicted  nucleic acid-binding Zn-ribbon protein
MMRRFILLIGILVMASAAHAATYEWTDSQGGLHFTDNLDKVPAKYLNKVRKVDVQPVIQEKEQPSQTEQKSIAPAAQNLFGGHDEMWWRSSFRALRDEMKNLQDGLPGKRDKLNELRRKLYIFSKPSARIAYNDMDAEIGRDETRITDLQKQLSDLDDAAAKAGVPMEWRK